MRPGLPLVPTLPTNSAGDLGPRTSPLWASASLSAPMHESEVIQSCPTLWDPMAPLSVGFSRQEYWSGVLFPSPGDLPNPGIKPCLLHCRQILYRVSYKGSPTQSLDPSSIQKVLIHLSVQTLWEQKHLTEQGSQFRRGGGGNVGLGDVCARRCVGARVLRGVGEV